MQHFTEKERNQIESYLLNGFNGMQIAKFINRPFQSVYREIKRGLVTEKNSDWTYKTIYRSETAQRVTRENGRNKGRSLAIGNNQELADRLEYLIINERYSPYSALEICKKEGLNVNICETTLYSYIHKGIFIELCDKHLIYKKKKKKKQEEEKRTAHNNRKGTLIDERPKEVVKRENYGHWEMDTVVGKQGTKECLFVLTERLSREQIILLALHKSIDCCVAIIDQLEQQFKERFSEKFKTITCDNGCEFLAQNKMEQSIFNESLKRVFIYYCHPYCSNERGTNENQNRIIRRFFPKGTDFSQVSPEEVRKVQDYMNNMPRRIFKGKSSLEISAEWGFA